jgi:hypothetical protein
MISRDAKRRLRRVYGGAFLAFTPLLVLEFIGPVATTRRWNSTSRSEFRLWRQAARRYDPGCATRPRGIDVAR